MGGANPTHLTVIRPSRGHRILIKRVIATLRLKGRYLPLISAPLIRSPTLPAIDPVALATALPPV
ncbi:hypothetical protein PORUE0001_0766 [Porphyromonas uenonis 60-3]|uniref:Uncharacterized protein n=1 Tax=Porphyromonas uenonis 60-3 TaxID=596327 RepID=C2MEF2_9PORP|nr:hypothetical protein PORUE0001_0766 [Porphyromonas uenonis 60-3]